VKQFRINSCVVETYILNYLFRTIPWMFHFCWCVTIGLLMRSVVCCVLCACHLPPSVSTAGWPGNGWNGSRVRQSSLSVHSLSLDKPFVEPPNWRCMVTEHFTTSGWSTWVSEEVCPYTFGMPGLPVCVFALMSMNRPPTMGK